MSDSNIIEKFKEIGEQVQRLQENLLRMRVEAEAGGGLVKVVANGYKQIVQLDISQELINSKDAALIAELVRAACNETLQRAQECAFKEMIKIPFPLNIAQVLQTL